MQFTVEDVSAVKKIIHVEIPEADVVAEMDAAYNELKKTSRIKGFRPGKAPRSVLERMFKNDVNQDVAGKLIQKSLIECIRESKLVIIGHPEIDPPEFKGQGPYKYEATVEIRPEIGKLDLSGIKLTKTRHAFSEDEVDSQIQMLRRNMAKKVPCEDDRPAVENDYILIDREGFQNGESFDKTPKVENQSYRLGSAILSRDFDEQLIGMKKGEEKEFTVVYPDDYVNKQLAGNTVDFKVVLKDIMVEKLPEVDDELAKGLGKFDSLEALKTEIRNNLQQGYDKRIEQELHEQIFQALIDRSSFDLPDVMVEFELNNMIAEAEQVFAANNITMEQLGQTREGLEKEYRETAANQVRRHLLLGAVIDHESLTLTDEEMEDGYQDLAKNFNQPVERIRDFYTQNPDKIEFFKHTLLEKKALRLIIDNSEIEELDPPAENAETEEAEAAQ